MLTTADLLTQVLSAVMGKKTVNPSDFFGPGCTAPEIPNNYFSSDRLHRHTGPWTSTTMSVGSEALLKTPLGDFNSEADLI